MKISAYSTALYSSFFFLEELGILFDCGDGAAAMLLGKSRKVKHIFISHADRDHLGGLLQFNQLNARKGFPKVYFPRDCGSFPFLEDFTKKFDPHVQATEWTKLIDEQEISIQKDIIVKAVKNNHIPTPNGEMKSHSFKVYKVKQKLKKEYLNLTGLEIKKERERLGIENMTNEIRENILTYSADTPIENNTFWNGSKILIHEATFLRRKDMGEKSNYWNKHSTLEEVMHMVANSKGIEKLILSHFSSRYNREEIQNAVDKEIALHKLDINVEIVFPGEFFCKKIS